MNKTTNWLDQVIEVQIEKVAHGGIFVARHEGRVVFVSHVLPGEIAKVRVFEDKGGSFCRAEPVEIIQASPDRVPHIWKNDAWRVVLPTSSMSRVRTHFCTLVARG